MHQVKKGNQYYFGMKLHVGVDSETGLAHSLAATAANAHDITQTHKLLHGKERVVWGDAGYTGIGKREEVRGLNVEWRIAMKAGKRRKLDPDGAEEAAEKAKASVRAKVEHPFLDVKRNFGYAKARYRGVGKERGAAGAVVGYIQSEAGAGHFGLAVQGRLRPKAGQAPTRGAEKGGEQAQNAPSGARWA